MATHKFVPVLLVVVLLYTGCTATYNFINARSMKNGLTELFQGKEIHIPLKSCKKMGKISRTGYCFTKASEKELEILIKTFDLQEEGLSGFMPLTSEEGCGTAMKGYTLYASQGNRPENLRLGPGTAFDFLYVYISPKSPVSCIQASFSFG